LYFILLKPGLVFAALPFVTDDAAISKPNQLLVEQFTEIWNIAKKEEASQTTMIGEYLGLSYGATKNLELTFGGLAGYDLGRSTKSFMNPIFQAKSMLYQSKESGVPDLAVSFGYVNKNGRGEYFDPATNYYIMGIATTKFFNDNLVVHVNSGPKASYDISGRKNVQRIQLGIAFDLNLIRRDIKLFAESYNGTPNSPRDSPGLFHSYQFGFKWIKSDDLSFAILYGNQPTFIGYNHDGSRDYQRTNWMQFGIRKSFDNIF
jgi:hypothetical protein